MILLRLALSRAATRPVTIILFLVVPVAALVLNLHGAVVPGAVPGGAVPVGAVPVGLLRGAVVDRDDTLVSQGLREVLARDLGPVFSAETGVIMHLLIEEEIHYAVIVPAGYEAALLKGGAGPPPPLEIVSLRVGLFAAVETVLQRYAGHAPFEAPALAPIPGSDRTLASQPIQPVRTLTGVLMLTLLLGAVFNAVDMVRDREQRVLHRVLAAPGGIVVYTAQHGIALALIAVVQAVAGIAAIAVAARIDPGSTLRLMVVVALFAVNAAALAVAIAGRVKTLSGTAVAAGFLALPLVMAGGGFWSRENMPAAAARLAYILPTTWAVAAVEGVLDGGPLVSYSVHLLALGLFTVLLVLLGPWKREDLGLR